MNREKMLRSPLPIDRLAAQVTRAARPENLWRPLPKEVPHSTPLGAVLAVAPIPRSAINNHPGLQDLPGKRRDRMVIVGYAKDQGSQNSNARWVVRCDCGNYEHRTKVFRWLGTAAPDMCRECQIRKYRLHGEQRPREPATRATAPRMRK